MIDLPDMPPQYAPAVIAQASKAQKGDVKTDRTIGVCHLIENPPAPPGTAVNSLSPVITIERYLTRQEQHTLNMNTAKVSVLQSPKFGELKEGWGGNYRYHPATDFYGQDRATVLVEIGGHKFKVVYFFNVLDAVPGGTDGYDPHNDKKYCPRGRSLWTIALNTK